MPTSPSGHGQATLSNRLRLSSGKSVASGYANTYAGSKSTARYRGEFVNSYEEVVKSRSYISSDVQIEAATRLDEVISSLSKCTTPQEILKRCVQVSGEKAALNEKKKGSFDNPKKQWFAAKSLFSSLKNKGHKSLKTVETEQYSSPLNAPPAFKRRPSDVKVSVTGHGAHFASNEDNDHSNGQRRGLYLWGPAGQGKSVLLELFENQLKQSFGEKAVARAHFVHWMLSVHQALHKMSMKNENDVSLLGELASVKGLIKNDEEAGGEKSSEALKSLRRNEAGRVDPDSMTRLASTAVSEGLRVVCLDEMQITNISDAMLFKRLGEILMSYGVVFIYTSNCPPEKLYENGLNRDRFVPFIHEMMRNSPPFILDCNRDFRALAKVQSRLQKVKQLRNNGNQNKQDQNQEDDLCVDDQNSNYYGDDDDDFAPALSGQLSAVQFAGDTMSLNPPALNQDVKRQGSPRRTTPAPRREIPRMDLKEKRYSKLTEYDILAPSLPYINPMMDTKKLLRSLSQSNDFTSPSTVCNATVDCYYGHSLDLMLYNEEDQTALAHFDALCRSNTAPSDFVSLASKVSRTLYLAGTPQLNVGSDDSVIKRFITLMDVFYEKDIKIVVDAAVQPLRIVGNVSTVVESFDSLLANGMKQNRSFDDFANLIFPSMTTIKHTDLREALIRIGLDSPTAEDIAESLPNHGSINKAVLRSAFCHHVIFAMCEAVDYLGDQPSRKIGNIISWLFPNNSKASLETLCETASATGGYSLTPKAGSSDVGFAVPRFISRLCQMAKPSF